MWSKSYVTDLLQQQKTKREDLKMRKWLKVGAVCTVLGIGVAVQQQRKKLDLNIGLDHSDKTVIITGSNTGVGKSIM